MIANSGGRGRHASKIKIGGVYLRLFGGTPKSTREIRLRQGYGGTGAVATLLLQAVDDIDGGGIDGNRCGIQTGAGGGQFDGAGSRGGTEGDAVDAAFGVEPEIVHGIDFAAVVPAAPDGGAFEFE